MNAPRQDAPEQAPEKNGGGTTKLLRRMRGTLRKWTRAAVRTGKSALGLRQEVKEDVSAALEPHARRGGGRTTVMGPEIPAEAAGKRVTTQLGLTPAIRTGRFGMGAFWCLNRVGFGHETNEDAQFFHAGRNLFVSVDGISGGDTGRQAAQTFVAVVKELCDAADRRQLRGLPPEFVPGPGETENGAILREAAKICAYGRFAQAGVADVGGVVYAALEFLRDGKTLRAYWQGDASAMKFLPKFVERPGIPWTPDEPVVTRLTSPDRLEGSASKVVNAVAPGDEGEFRHADFPVVPGEYAAACSDGVSDNFNLEFLAKFITAGHADDQLLGKARQDRVPETEIAKMSASMMSRALQAFDEKLCAKMSGAAPRPGKPDNFNLIVVRFDGPAGR